jgi:ABC-type phosphate transport system substrate-binding protein
MMKFRWICHVFILTGMLFHGFVAQAEQIAVIANPKGPVSSLSQKQISNLYLGRKKGSTGLRLFGHSISSGTRAKFFKKINGMSLSQVNAYWARLKFTGQVFPPRVLSSDKAVIDAVRRQKNAIGYINANALTAGVKVVKMLR